ncbi:hypothetical protein pW2_204 [Bacillus phage pW2]|uniref:Uncharacterized protein n=1 Tax=Bacillus phage pW2 TaxID=2500559 RepID=A0A3T0IHX6_9CAUD|nr:hypothetical protein PQE69_gp121 [Bacillus phage pW2]AZU98997.1 hypothetical protein pW2_204 [Bacillus phage pW2]
MTDSMIEGLIGLASIFGLCMVVIASGWYSRTESEKKEVQDKERLKRVRAETNQYLKEQGYKPKIKIEVKDSTQSSFSPKRKTTVHTTKSSTNNRSNNDDYHRTMEIIRNSNLGE